MNAVVSQDLQTERDSERDSLLMEIETEGDSLKIR